MDQQQFDSILDEIRLQTAELKQVSRSLAANNAPPSPSGQNSGFNPGPRARALGDALDDANRRVGTFGRSTGIVRQALDKTAQGATNLAGVLTKFASRSSNVSSDLTALTPAVNLIAAGAGSTAKALGGVVSAAGSLASLFGPGGLVAGTVISGLGKTISWLGEEGAKKAADAANWYLGTLQAMSADYTALSKAGGVASGGLTEFANNANKMLVSLGSASHIASEFGSNLSRAYGSVGRGLAEVADASAAMGQEQRSQLMALGITLEEQNESIAAYSKIHIWNTRREKMTTDELAKSAAAYMYETDALAKLLGVSRKEAQDKLASQASEVQWGIITEDLGDVGKAMRSFVLSVEKDAGPEVAASLKDFIDGVMNTEDAQKLFATQLGAAGPEIVAAMQRLKELGPNEVEKAYKEFDFIQSKLVQGYKQSASKDLERSAVGGVESLQSMFKLGVSLRQLTGVVEKNGLYSTRREAIEAGQEQAKQDAASKNLASAQLATAELNAVINQEFIKTLPKATEMIDRAAGVMSKTVAEFRDTIYKLLGDEPPKATTAIDRPKSPLEQQREIIDRIRNPDQPNRPYQAPSQGSIRPGNIADSLSAAGITDRRAQANILAQIQAESNFVPRSENLNYSGKKLYELFGPNQSKNKVRFQSLDEANALASQGPEAVGNVIYGNRMGNAGDEGFKYRGRGLIQLTGKNNYEKFAKLTGADLVNNPDLANDPAIATKIAVAYMKEKEKAGVNLTDIKAVGKAMGFATNDQARREEYAAKFEKQLKNGGFKTGGISSGPTEGYTQLLHGTEAIVPLPDGKSIPVSVSGLAETLTPLITATMAGPAPEKYAPFSVPKVELAEKGPMSVQMPEIRELNSRMTEQMGAMQMQLSKLSEMVDIMRRGVQLNEKMLQAARN